MNLIQSAVGTARDTVSSASADHGLIDIIVVVLAIAVVVWVLVLAIRYFIAPGEQDPDHIKRSIFK